MDKIRIKNPVTVAYDSRGNEIIPYGIWSGTYNVISSTDKETVLDLCIIVNQFKGPYYIGKEHCELIK